MSNQTPEEIAALQARKAKGKAGKLFRIEVLCNFGKEVKRFELTNRYSEEVMKFREYIFQIGLSLPIEPGRWVVIHPMDIKEITIWRQNTFFD